MGTHLRVYDETHFERGKSNGSSASKKVNAHSKCNIQVWGDYVIP